MDKQFEDMTSEEIAGYVIGQYKAAGQDEESAIRSGIIACNIYLEDLRVSMKVCEGLHPHSNGLVAGSMVTWMEIRKIFEDKLNKENES